MYKYKVAVITASDKGAAGQREDLSGPAVQDMMRENGYEITCYKILPDNRLGLEEAMKEIADKGIADLIITTGGTGFSPRDWTPEATRNIAERIAPGIGEAMRAASMKITNRAILSRGIAAIRGRCLIVNLPGSPKAARENLEAVLPSLEHGLDMLTDRKGECATTFSD